MSKVAVYAICKNEIANIDDWLASCAGADYVVVVDTGSTDGTVDAVARHMAVTLKPQIYLHQAHIAPWRFDVAHNVALALVPADAQICIPLALDERLSPGWRTVINHTPAWDRGTPTKILYDYEFAPGYVFTHDRIHTREGYVWRYPFHEGCYPVDEAAERRVPAGVDLHDADREHQHLRLRITQVQNHKVNRLARDCALAELALREYPDHPRMVFYAGRQFFYAGDHVRALPLLRRYMTMRKPWNPWEEAHAGEILAQCVRAHP